MTSISVGLDHACRGTRQCRRGHACSSS
jgi:hypothetical protein